VKLLIKQYLASLKERGELDAILPDLLSQMGLNVFSRPARGTRQNGVDVGAVGSIDGGTEKVYLLTIKPGDLTRASWNADGPQAVRPSLDEIQDAYIPNRLPNEHRDKEIVICVCCGGDIQEQVREQWEGYRSQRTKECLSFEEWNGDKLAERIQNNFLREDLLPDSSRSLLRKSLALLDEPQASYRHFSRLIASLSEIESKTDSERLMALRQMSLCLWILFAWAKDDGNLESAYRSAELALLHGWFIARGHVDGSKQAESIHLTFVSILSTYQKITGEYLAKSILPHVEKQHGLSSAVRASSSLDVNLKLFDVLGRLATAGLWAYWSAVQCGDEQNELKQQCMMGARNCLVATRHLIESNPALLLPIADDQAIDISSALLLSSFHDDAKGFIDSWLPEILGRASFAYSTHGLYPCVHRRYSDLLEHPKKGDDEYRKSATSGSILYPTISLYAALYDLDDLYHGVADFKNEHLAHCNFQFWFPDETSEALIYRNSDMHGAVASHVGVHRTKEEFIKEIFDECEQSSHFTKLSAVEHGMWPIIIVACRHYRLPVPLHLLEGLRKNGAKDSGDTGSGQAAAPDAE
jgi:hypothetical protein